MHIPVKPLLALLLLASAASAQTTRNVPADFETIQEAIEASAAGDTVLVAPGTYVENLNFRGKNITVRGMAGAAMTIIDGNDAGSVVTFRLGEGNAAVLSGFTLRNGKNSAEGGGIFISSSSPTVQDNVIVDNVSCNGLGIAIVFGSPLIQGNIISNNRREGCSGGVGGGGIEVRGTGTARILSNVITGNVINASGGGIALFGAGTPTIRDNVLSGNSAASGGGIDMVNVSNAVIVGNQISGNTAQRGGGVAWAVPSGATGPVLVNNTIADNEAQEGSGVYADGFDSQARLVNNIVVGKSGQTAIYCTSLFDPQPPIFQDNDVFTPNGAAYGGACGAPTGTNGNISVDPQLAFDAASGHYRLTRGSPAIDVGDNAAPQLPSTDLEELDRVVDGDCNGTATVDLGAIEYPVGTLEVTPATLDFGSQPVGTSSNPREVTLRNASCGALEISSITTLGNFSSSTTCGATLPVGGSCQVQVFFKPLGVGSLSGSLQVRTSGYPEPFQVALSGIGTDPPDAGPPDAGVADAGQPDGGVTDAGLPDAGAPDAGPPDAGPPDAGPPDAGQADGGDPGDGDPDEEPGGGCGCQSGLPGGGAMLAGWLLLVLACLARSRLSP
jgi:parallel beta-helix repeat protein